MGHVQEVRSIYRTPNKIKNVAKQQTEKQHKKKKKKKKGFFFHYYYYLPPVILASNRSRTVQNSLDDGFHSVKSTISARVCASRKFCRCKLNNCSRVRCVNVSGDPLLGGIGKSMANPPVRYVGLGWRRPLLASLDGSPDHTNCDALPNVSFDSVDIPKRGAHLCSAAEMKVLLLLAACVCAHVLYVAPISRSISHP